MLTTLNCDRVIRHSSSAESIMKTAIISGKSTFKDLQLWAVHTNAARCCAMREIVVASNTC